MVSKTHLIIPNDEKQVESLTTLSAICILYNVARIPLTVDQFEQLIHYLSKEYNE